mmetsp:Transcript_5015/g.11286  ORF Transcript_5015/g.11286 Transcript_5015/m.11286 type:complete len:125 (+) Transcript_5015:3089-3463(+)
MRFASIPDKLFLNLSIVVEETSLFQAIHFYGNRSIFYVKILLTIKILRCYPVFSIVGLLRKMVRKSKQMNDCSAVTENKKEQLVSLTYSLLILCDENNLVCGTEEGRMIDEIKHKHRKPYSSLL